MRKILYRGKCIGDIPMKGMWIEGNVLYDGVTGKCYIHIGDNCLNESDKAGEEGLLQFMAYEVDPETVCQYTGLADRNGRKIFEGDIIRDEDIAGIILFGREEGSFHVGFYIKWLNGVEYRKELGYWASKCEVAGNIFDNPELIK